MSIVVQATHDFTANDGDFRNDAQQLLSFSRGTLIQLTSSSNGWSYGSILRCPDDLPRSRNDASNSGWFPTSYVNNVAPPPVTPPTTTYENDVWNKGVNQSSSQSPFVTEESTMGIPSSYSASAPSIYIPRPPPVLDDDDDDGFNAVPMGYDQPQSYDEQRNPLPYRPEEEPAEEVLPEGVKVVPVPGRRHLHSYIPLAGGRKLMRSLHQNAVQPIVTQCTRKKKDEPLRPSVFISP